MSDFVIVNLFVLLFRTVMVLVGLAFAYLGYNLFRIGVYEKAGDLKAAWGDRNLALKQAAPGTFFALFGVIVVGISVIRGADMHSMTTVTGDTATQTRTNPISETVHRPPVVAQKLEKFGLGVDTEDESNTSVPPKQMTPETPESLVARLITEGTTDKAAIESLYLATLGRFPTEKEKQVTSDQLVSDVTRKKATYEDVAWALMNSREFLARTQSLGNRPRPNAQQGAQPDPDKPGE